jgi:hypothetical protein
MNKRSFKRSAFIRYIFRTEKVHSATVFYNIGLVDPPVYLLSCMYGGSKGRDKKEGRGLGTYSCGKYYDYLSERIQLFPANIPLSILPAKY